MNKKYTLALIALCSMGGTYAQSLTQAKQWFEEGKFAEAKPVFQKLVKQAHRMQITISGTEHAAMKPVNYRNHNPTLKKVLHAK